MKKELTHPCRECGKEVYVLEQHTLDDCRRWISQKEGIHANCISKEEYLKSLNKIKKSQSEFYNSVVKEKNAEFLEILNKHLNKIRGHISDLGKQIEECEDCREAEDKGFVYCEEHQSKLSHLEVQDLLLQKLKEGLK